MFKEYCDYDGLGLASLVKDGQVSQAEVLQAATSMLERWNPAINAVVHQQQPENEPQSGLFKGVPFLLKDLLGEQAGEPSTASCVPMKDWVAPANSELVNRFLASGLRVIGRTNTPQLGIYGVTESEFRGPCLNPWNIEHTPGGSSGGSAAAVAARIVPIAHAGDGGGSIRIPASHCGLVGLKPTRARLPAGPFRGERWGGFVSEGVVSRSVRDTAAVLDCVSGSDLGAPYHCLPKRESYLQQLEASTGKLRIAFTDIALFGDETHQDNRSALQHTVKLLEELGHDVVCECPEFDKEALVVAYYIVVGAGVALGVRQMEEKLGRKLRESELELSSWAMATIGEAVSAGEYTKHLDFIHKQTRRVASFFERVDVLVTPTAARPPVRIGAFALSSADRFQIRVLRKLKLRSLIDKALDSLATKAICATPNTMLFNQTGQPAVTVPLYWNCDNLPIGTQLVAATGQELRLLQLARQLEQLHPWSDRRPSWVSEQ